MADRGRQHPEPALHATPRIEPPPSESQPPDVVGSAFVPALELSRDFHREVVAPILAPESPPAALLGWGSDVLGYDTPTSTDHGWGPRLLVFAPDDARASSWQERIDCQLPDTFRGWPVRFGWDEVEPRSHVEVTTLARWCTAYLGVDATRTLDTFDWLVMPQQLLLGVTAGVVHADPDGQLGELRVSLGWFPDQVWRWLIGCQWHRIGQEEAFVARTAGLGDETGSAITAARLARDLMRLALLFDRRYAPYQKWLGTAFARMPHHDDLPAHLAAVVRAADAPRRESVLAAAYVDLAVRFNALGLCPRIEPTVSDYYQRPAQVIFADRFADATFDTVTDPELRQLPPIGSVDQLADSTDLLSSGSRSRLLLEYYRTAVRD